MVVVGAAGETVVVVVLTAKAASVVVVVVVGVVGKGGVLGGSPPKWAAPWRPLSDACMVSPWTADCSIKYRDCIFCSVGILGGHYNPGFFEHAKHAVTR